MFFKQHEGNSCILKIILCFNHFHKKYIQPLEKWEWWGLAIWKGTGRCPSFSLISVKPLHSG